LIRTRKDKSYDNDKVGVVNDESNGILPNSNNNILPNNVTDIDNFGGEGENACKKLKMDNTVSANSSAVECSFKSVRRPSVLEENCSLSASKDLEPNQESVAKEEVSEGHSVVDNERSISSEQQSESCKEHKLGMEENIEGHSFVDDERSISNEHQPESHKEHHKTEEGSYTSLDIGEEYHDPTCTECKRAWKIPKKSELIMYLHAHAYKVFSL